MKKAVMISIRPEWCELIANGKKTVEVRKNSPKLNVPFKCYIYCTQGKKNDPHDVLEIHGSGGKIHKANGKVVGEFVCDRIDEFKVFENGAVQNWNYAELEKSCLTYDAIAAYVGIDEYGYAWRITDLAIYDTPKELSEFAKPDKCPYHGQDKCTYPYHCFRAGQLKRCGDWMEKPPQSWCYVQELA